MKLLKGGREGNEASVFMKQKKICSVMWAEESSVSNVFCIALVADEDYF